jgi:prepilin peptidase CpaA
MPTLLINFVLFGVLAIACASDLRTRRIPNVLTFSTLGVGILLNTVFDGLGGTRDAAIGLVLGFGMLFPLYMLKWMGAGDVKLMAAIGALKGPEFVFYACLWAAVFGAAIALIGLLRARRLSIALTYMYYSGLRPQGGSFLNSGFRMPYAPAIAMGCMLTLLGVRGLGTLLIH